MSMLIVKGEKNHHILLLFCWKNVSFRSTTACHWDRKKNNLLHLIYSL